MREFDILEIKASTLGSSATKEQQQSLVDWIVQNIGRDYWRGVADQLCMDGLTHAYTLITERCGEFGYY